MTRHIVSDLPEPGRWGREYIARLGVRLLLISIPTMLAIVFTGTAAGSDNGNISGTVFDDRNGDGVRQPEEGGLSAQEVTLTLDSSNEQSQITEGGGSFVFTDVPAGDHTVSADVGAPDLTVCIDFFVGFNPHALNGCWNTAPKFWMATTDNPLAVSLAPGGSVTADFGSQRRDISTLIGVAFLDGNYPPVGTTIQAMHDGTECGTTEVMELGGNRRFTFDLDVFGASERPGCADSGDTVSFLVGGSPAIETVTWADLARSELSSMTAMPDHAWYWSELAAGSAHEGEVVTAKVGDVVCGQTEIEEDLARFGAGPAFGFFRLIVPAESVMPGCGSPGAMVELALSSGPSVTVEWEPGIQEVDIPLPSNQVVWGDHNCSGSADPVDSLLTLRFDAGLDTGTGECPNLGQVVDVQNASPHPWGDVDCRGEITPVDSLKLLRFDAGFSVAQEPECPEIGSAVLITP